MTSDRRGWWNLHSVTPQGEVTVLHSEDAEFGGPLWQIGALSYGAFDAAHILALRTLGGDSLVILDLPPAPRSPSTCHLPVSDRPEERNFGTAHRRLTGGFTVLFCAHPVSPLRCRNLVLRRLRPRRSRRRHARLRVEIHRRPGRTATRSIRGLSSEVTAHPRHQPDNPSATASGT